MGDQHQVHVWENTYIMAPKEMGSRASRDRSKLAFVCVEKQTSLDASDNLTREVVSTLGKRAVPCEGQ